MGVTSMGTILLIVIVAILLLGVSAVTSFLYGFFVAAIALAALIVVALFFDVLLPYLFGFVAFFVAAVGIKLLPELAKMKEERLLREIRRQRQRPNGEVALLRTELEQLKQQRATLAQFSDTGSLVASVDQRIRTITDQLPR